MKFKLVDLCVLVRVTLHNGKQQLYALVPKAVPRGSLFNHMIATLLVHVLEELDHVVPAVSAPGLVEVVLLVGVQGDQDLGGKHLNGS